MIERTLAILKPRALQEPGVADDILKRITRAGVRVIRVGSFVPSQKRVEQHYAEHTGRDYFDRLVRRIANQRIFVMILEGENAIDWWRAEMGDFREENRSPGTIRGDWMKPGDALDDNLTHGSDAEETFQRERLVWFPDREPAADSIVHELVLTSDQLDDWANSFSPEES